MFIILGTRGIMNINIENILQIVAFTTLKKPSLWRGGERDEENEKKERVTEMRRQIIFCH